MSPLFVASALLVVSALLLPKAPLPAGLEREAITLAPPENSARENAYLRQRNDQLQGDVTALPTEVERLGQIVERLLTPHFRRRMTRRRCG